MLPQRFHPAVDGWFAGEFSAPTTVQLAAWEAIAQGQATLISAPTGSGKTLAGFLGIIDELVHAAGRGPLADETRVLYVSPLRALSNDVQKNLEAPLAGIRRELAARMLGDAPIRAWVRTGDTPQSERARMRRSPPHILVTTPESLYILLTSDSGRNMLSTLSTVIVDEIHALAGNKRGAHLALSLQRLDALCEATGNRKPTRVGISATTRPLQTIATYLTGDPQAPCTIIDEGHTRERDLTLELPGSPLEAIMSNEVWTEVYDRIASLASEHRTTLVFVNTRRHAERAARHLADRLGEDLVTSHHGSLSKELRLNAEQRLKAGKLRALVATSSLELGIDIGDVDLVCQLGSPRAIAALLQRVGRSGHGLDRVPKGRLFPLSRDELVECAALLECVRRGELDAIRRCDGALDVLSQQIVAELGMREWSADQLFALVRGAACYRELKRDTFDAVVTMLADGFSTQRGRRGAHVHYDRVNGMLRGRRGARLTAITNGGAIPDQFDYDAVLLPSEQIIGTLNEDFAIESLPGDVFQLGNTSYRIRKIGSGKVFVEDAQGQPPNIPFWLGEALGRTDELSSAVARLRRRVGDLLESHPPGDRCDAVALQLAAETGLPAAAAGQLVAYLATAKTALNGLPDDRHIIFERFFDEAGDTHLVIHSPYGSRVNRAWGLALRKRFCRRFNFELQAAALEDTIVISLGAVHSFALEEVIGYLRSNTVRDVLAQAVLAAPLFPARWRWNATTALAVKRFRNGRRAPPQFQRTDAEDLLAVVFPDQLACAENLGGGDRDIPDHPLVAQTLFDCLNVAMDITGLERLLARIEQGEVTVLCRELTSPSPLAQEVLGAKPYAFLDDAPAEERRTLAVQSRRYMNPEQAADLGRLDDAAIDRVRQEAWPDVRDAEELHEALALLGFLTAAEGAALTHDAASLFAALVDDRRACVFRPVGGERLWVSAERLAEVALALPQGVVEGPAPAVLPVPDGAPATADDALREVVRSRLEGLGPVTAARLAAPLGLTDKALAVPLAALEQEGFVMRGRFTSDASAVTGAEEWCDRRLLARIHRYTLKRLRSEIEPVTLADYQRFLFDWQGLGEERREGEEAVYAVLTELEGLALPAIAWERDVLPARIAAYGGDLLDRLSTSGRIVWWRPRPGGAPISARPTTVAASPIMLVPRATLAHWRVLTERDDATAGSLSASAARVHQALTDHGALFFIELVERTGLLRVQVEEALGELAARGIVTADSVNGLRALLVPQSRRRGFHGRSRRRAAVSFDAAGRWALMPPVASDREALVRDATEHAARTLLHRYGIVCRAVLSRETALPPWRDLLTHLRRWEARGEIRGGRFVEVLGGEQFALTDAVERLRRVRRNQEADEWLALSAADPLAMVALTATNARVPALAGHRIVYRNGVAVAAQTAAGVNWFVAADEAMRARVQAMLGPGGSVRAGQPDQVAAVLPVGM